MWCLDEVERTAETPKPSCSFPSVQCPDSAVCINPAQLCDGIRDCPDGSDENCVKNCADESENFINFLYFSNISL